MLAPPEIANTNSQPSAMDETDQLIQGIFEPPDSFIWAAIMRNKLLVCAVAVALALIGGAYGLSRPRIYTASADLQVGQVNPNSPGFYSYVLSASALATAFSRAIDAEPVLATVQHKLALTPSTAIGRLSAAPIPDSPAFRVIATGPTSSAAIQLANVSANAVIAYESESNSANPEAASLLREYREASYRLQQLVSSDARLALKKNLSAEEHARAEAEKSAVEVRLKAIGSAYLGAVASQAPRSGLVSLIAGASGATSDHRSKAEIYGFVGLLAGIVLGCLAAALRERRRVNRRLAPSADGGMQSAAPA
jgi:hypothetical protein